MEKSGIPSALIKILLHDDLDMKFENVIRNLVSDDKRIFPAMEHGARNRRSNMFCKTTVSGTFAIEIASPLGSNGQTFIEKQKNHLHDAKWFPKYLLPLVTLLSTKKHDGPEALRRRVTPGLLFFRSQF